MASDDNSTSDEPGVYSLPDLINRARSEYHRAVKYVDPKVREAQRLACEIARRVVRDIYRFLASRNVQIGIAVIIGLLILSAALAVLSVVAYLLFYNRFLPDQLTTVPVHLQYGYGANCWGLTSLAHTNLKTLQPYDISLSLTVPRSPANLERGNFMVAVHLLYNPKLSRPSTPWQERLTYFAGADGEPLIPTESDPGLAIADKVVMYTATRPALIPYTHPVVELASRLLFLPYHIFYPHSEATTLKIGVVERLAFPRAGILPNSVYVEVQAGQTLQTYKASVTFSAQLGGLRWAMYQFWGIPAFVVFTFTFWAVSMSSTLTALAAIGAWINCPEPVKKVRKEIQEDRKGKGQATIKAEGEHNEDGLSDTERTFPSSSKQPALKFEGRIKQEEGVDDSVAQLVNVPPAAEADDEDDGDDFGDPPPDYRDSGIGTSYDDSVVSREGVKRRRSGQGLRRGG
ncbi:putative adipose-regulatory protein-domain-containing protein [Apodospora peruviana]|uniref:Adipose-regulatory protein-domain-containing protein n=1 Tax=Apodospora peruviana TaxID=516989 RepID=A0AAE0I0V5_9PEZI|nr:putative adipose-regulatory protein-domain-containing protein [Apodospora peruviana]